jgi:protein-S-isoprenylcysteine O-methyltransferase Ste14
MIKTSPASKAWIIVGWLAIAIFVVIYGVELLPHHGPPVTVRWIREQFGQTGIIILNILIVLGFLVLLPFRRRTKSIWKSHGTFAAFTIALMTEMFGWPLVIFLVSPLFNIPVLAPKFFQAVGHWPSTVGTAMSLVGIVLVAAAWKRIHRSEGLVTTGLYGSIRHPQYTGIILFTLGWIIHWPTVVTLILWPILAGAYVWLARSEEKDAVEEFGQAYIDYASRTKRFIPFVV